MNTVKYLCNLFQVAVKVLLNLLAGLGVEDLLPVGNLLKVGGAEGEHRLHALLYVVQPAT